MKVIYSCYWGSCLAMVAAFLHLEYIDEEREIFPLNLFNNISDCEFGELIHVGRDDKGRDVFAIGTKNSGKILAKTLVGIAGVYGFPADSVQFVDLNHLYNGTILLGVFLIRIFNLGFLGRRLIVSGIKKNFGRLKNLVQSVRAKQLAPTERGGSR
ncbi:MAG: DUF3189 family protein [Tepidanaerobacteraceae bacterium]|jgi:hypothetical protein|nr:DUF3189 family protein [Tepidanaerobacter sp.]HQA59717.1 DUF3189 family protein [Tepidanaerobacteraceae bacterium]HQE05064.1 DUF3189 family protein [Tepidanaerobacteraceae bacterium]